MAKTVTSHKIIPSHVHTHLNTCYDIQINNQLSVDEGEQEGSRKEIGQNTHGMDRMPINVVLDTLCMMGIFKGAQARSRK